MVSSFDGAVELADDREVVTLALVQVQVALGTWGRPCGSGRRTALEPEDLRVFTDGATEIADGHDWHDALDDPPYLLSAKARHPDVLGGASQPQTACAP